MSERRTELETAFRQAHRAAKQGDLAAADRWSKTAERLASAVGTMDAAHAAEEEQQRLEQAQAEEMVCVLFTKAAYIAHAMVHAPTQAPAAFQGLIKLWREQNLGEGEEDANRAAAKLAASQAAFLEGRFEETLPNYVRERLEASWKERRERLASEPIVPVRFEES